MCQDGMVVGQSDCVWVGDDDSALLHESNAVCTKPSGAEVNIVSSIPSNTRTRSVVWFVGTYYLNKAMMVEHGSEFM